MATTLLNRSLYLQLKAQRTQILPTFHIIQLPTKSETILKTGSVGEGGHNIINNNNKTFMFFYFGGISSPPKWQRRKNKNERKEESSRKRTTTFYKTFLFVWL